MMLPLTLLLLSLTARAGAPAALTDECASMWTNQPLEGRLAVADGRQQLLGWTDPIPAEGVTVWVCASRPAYAWLWQVLPDGTPAPIWPLGTNTALLEAGRPEALPQASLIGVAQARSLLLALSAEPTRPQPIAGFTWRAMGPNPVVKLNLPGWPAQVLWEPISLGPPEATGAEPPR